MSFAKRFFGHLHTINTHRFLVMKTCFKCGMYAQGLLHDLSKYSFSEFWPSVTYFQGDRSPISKEKQVRLFAVLAASQRQKQTSLGILDRQARQRYEAFLHRDALQIHA